MRRLPQELLERLRAPLRASPDAPADPIRFMATAAGLYFLIAAAVELWRFVTADILRPLWLLARPWLLALVLVIGPAAAVAADPYFNSSEPGCDGSDSNVKMCEDFETSGVANSPDGKWYGEDCDQANANGGIATRTKGWCGQIFANPITPAGAAECGGAGVAGSCAGTSGVKGGSVGGRNMADHSLVGLVEVPELYVRWYYKASVGYLWSGQKVLTINRCCAGVGGIWWGNFGFNTNGAEGPSGSPPAIVFNNYHAGAGPDPVNLFQNQGNNLNIVGGRWYALQTHIKLNDVGFTNGIFEFYGDDCGTDGTACSGSMTLRMQHTGISFDRTSTNGAVGTLWFENWANSGDGVTCPPAVFPNCGSVGTEWYDLIKVSTIGPIGFAGVEAPPAGPTARLLAIIASIVFALGLALMAHQLERGI